MRLIRVKCGPKAHCSAQFMNLFGAIIWTYFECLACIWSFTNNQTIWVGGRSQVFGCAGVDGQDFWVSVAQSFYPSVFG